MLRHVRFRAARLARVVQVARAESHEIRGLDLDRRFGDRELHALVLADQPAEDLALARVARGLLDEPASVADAFGGDDRALGVEAVQELAKAAALDADQVLRGNLEVVEE